MNKFEEWKQGLTIEEMALKIKDLTIEACKMCPAIAICGIATGEDAEDNPSGCYRTFTKWANTEVDATNLDDAPKEIKAEILKNAEKLEGMDSMNLKIGDKVKIKKGLIDGTIYGGVRYINRMAKNYENLTISCIEKICNNTLYQIKETNNTWLYSAEMFEPVERDLKALLTAGRSVELRNGDVCRIFTGVEDEGTIFVDVENNSYITLKDYDDNLKHKSGEWQKDLDIIKINECPSNGVLLTAVVGNLLWQHQEPSPEQLKIKQLETELQKYKDGMESVQREIDKLKGRE